jgi:Asp-tRNA(Asn)/Glu-tRNA(Gln) amidotransferase A subunit family amidase
LRVAVAGDYFTRLGLREVFAPVESAARALGTSRVVTIPNAEQARAAAYLITACEGGSLHLPDLRTRPQDFDPLTVERLLTGALLPGAWYSHAQRFRSLFRDQVRELFRTVDVILAPATPCPAPRIGQETIMLGGSEVPARPNLGVFTQPISFIGLPVVLAPIFEPGELPLGVQVIAAPYNEAAALRVAWQLEAMGVAKAPVAAVVQTV